MDWDLGLVWIRLEGKDCACSFCPLYWINTEWDKCRSMLSPLSRVYKVRI